MNQGIFAEERIFDDNLSKDMTLYKEDTAKSRSPLLNSDLFSFNSQDVLKLDLETEVCLINYNDIVDICPYDDYEEVQKDFSVYLNKGGKKHMEDRVKVAKISQDKYFFGVYDGHGSAEVADYLVETLHEEIFRNPDFDSDPINSIINSFHKIDEQILFSQTNNNKNTGSVALCALIIKDLLYILNLGDSKAVMIDKQGKSNTLSQEHIPSRPDELERIEKMGGMVIMVHDQHRVMGQLAVSRSFGDKYYKPFVSSTPEIFVYQLDKNLHKYLVLASDGLWNEINNQELESFVKGKRSDGLAKEIFKETIEKNDFVLDNTAIVCIDIEKLMNSS